MAPEISIHHNVAWETELDPLSDRYRVCPNCSIPHMVRNRGRDFCSDRCADQHYNTRRRLLKQADPKNNAVMVADDIIVPEASAEEIAQPEIIVAIEPIQVNSESTYGKNIRILNSMQILFPDGTTYPIEDLTKSGFDFNTYTDRGVLHNIDPELNCHFLQYEMYRIYRVDVSHVLIAKVEPLKTKTDD